MTITTADDQSPDHIWAQPSCNISSKPPVQAYSEHSGDLKLFIVFGFAMLLVLWLALMVVGIFQYYERPWDLFIYWTVVSTTFGLGGILACQGLQ